MKNKLFPLALFILASVFITSCEDFIATDLGKKSIVILAPANNTILTSFSPLFKWEELKGADKYQLQIVKPNFGNIAQFILDTSTSSTEFPFTLPAGNYQWRVRAKNNASMTEYVTYNLTIDSSSSLAGSSVTLSLPHDNFYTNNMANTFTWQYLPSATNYVFQVFSSSGSSVSLQSTTSLTASYTFTAEGVYQWRVFAQNSISNSGYYTYNFTIDTTKPLIPTPIFPLTDTITADPVPLKWNSSPGTDSTHLLVSSDSTFVTSTDIVIANTANPTVYNFSAAVPGVYYYWKVQAIDKAGNKSNGYSIRRRFKRN